MNINGGGKLKRCGGIHQAEWKHWKLKTKRQHDIVLFLQRLLQL